MGLPAGVAGLLSLGTAILFPGDWWRRLACVRWLAKRKTLFVATDYSRNKQKYVDFEGRLFYNGIWRR